MGICCEVQVDVNGEEIFFVDKKVLESFSGRLSKLFSKSAGTTSRLKVILHEFPGGAQGFELFLRFCCSHGKFYITPSNIFLLHCAANYMEIKEECSGMLDLKDQIGKYLMGIEFWTWSELLSCLKQCQDLLADSNSPCPSILDKFVDLFVGRLSWLNVTNSYTSSSSEGSSSRLSSYTNSDGAKSNFSRSTWWFEDLIFFNTNLLRKVTQALISQKFDHSTICSFLFYYERSKLLRASPAMKRKIVETVIDLLLFLHRSSVSSRALFDTFGLALGLKVSNSCMTKLENLIASKLDQATIDDLLVPSTKSCKLMDLYLAEVAPDPYLRPSKFVALAKSLPNFARDSDERLYLAIDTYLKVHSDICQDEKKEVCSALNFSKQSTEAEATSKLARNPKFLAQRVITAQISNQCKPKSPIQIQDSWHIATLKDAPLCYTRQGSRSKNVDAQQILLCAK
ncbi:hypothetical protein NMG60_11012535 [Bertholletia excelsa]